MTDAALGAAGSIRNRTQLGELSREPQAMQLRYFAALHDVASERSSTIVFPLPTDGSAHPSRPTTGRGEVTLVRSDFDHRREWRAAQNKNVNIYTIEKYLYNFSSACWSISANLWCRYAAVAQARCSS
jgi:hypothetical protein